MTKTIESHQYSTWQRGHYDFASSTSAQGTQQPTNQSVCVLSFARLLLPLRRFEMYTPPSNVHPQPKKETLSFCNLELSSMTMTLAFELDLDTVRGNQHEKISRSSHLVQTLLSGHTHTEPTDALSGLLKWPR